MILNSLIFGVIYHFIVPQEIIQFLSGIFFRIYMAPSYGGGVNKMWLLKLIRRLFCCFMIKEEGRIKCSVVLPNNVTS